jgi:large subunit ribosomal protein L4
MRSALYGALTMKVKEGAVKVVEELIISEPKAKALMVVLKGLQLGGKTLILADNPSLELKRAAGNLPWVTVQDLGHLNLYDVLRHDHLLIKRQDLETLQQRFINQFNNRNS